MLATKVRRFGWICFALLWLPFCAIFAGMIGLPSGDYAWSELPRLARYGIIGTVGFTVLSLGSMLASLIIGWASNRSLRSHGRPARATLLEIRDTGTTVNQSPLAHLKLRVEPADMPPFEAETEQLINRLQIPQFQPGVQLAVRFDPKSREVALDTTSALRPDGAGTPSHATQTPVRRPVPHPNPIVEE